jgi:CBS domain-containing protein
MEAKDIMTREVVTVSPSLPVKMLANLLIKNQISGAPVADKKGQIVGLVSETDLIAKKGKQVKTIMSNKVVQITEETPVEEIARLMTAHKIRRLPVMRGKSLLGIVSRADVVGAIARGQHIALQTPTYDL